MTEWKSKWINHKNLGILVAFLHWAIFMLTGYDRLYFVSEMPDGRDKIYRFLFLPVLLCLWQVIFRVAAGCRRQKTVKRAAIYFLIYSSVMAVFGFFLWPGTWSWDDIMVLKDARYFTLYPWQHCISSLVQIFSLQLLPFPGGVVIVQVLILSGIAGYCIATLEDMFQAVIHRPVLLRILLFIPFLLPPVILYNFSPFRAVLYAYLELLFAVCMVSWFWTRKEMTSGRQILLVILAILLGTWRSEGIYYILIVPFLLLLLGRTVISLRRVVLLSVLTAAGILGISFANNRAVGSSEYSLVSTLMPATELVREADPKEDAELLGIMNQVIVLDCIYDDPELDGVALYWQGGFVRDSYSEEAYSAYMKAFAKLVGRYPEVFLKERVRVFFQGSGLIPDTQRNIIRDTGTLFEVRDQKAVNERANYYFVTEAGGYLLYPPQVALRSVMVRSLGFTDSNYDPGKLFPVFWNIVTPMIFLILLVIVLLADRKWFLAAVTAGVGCKIPIIFLTAPGSYFMYYYSIYLVGYMAFIVLILLLYHKAGSEQKKRK